MLDELLDRLGVGVGLLLHYGVSGEARGLLGVFALHHSRGDSDHRGTGWHFLDDNRVRADTRAVADGKAAEDLRPRANDHAGTERRMALGSRIKRRAAESHPLVNRAAIADFGGLADDHAHAVVDEDAGADLGAGMDLDPGKPAPDMRGE